MAADPVSISIHIEASPEVVFDYFTEPRLMLTWMGEHAALDARPGGVFEIDIRGTPVRGRYVEVERPRRLVFTWGHAGSPALPPGSSTVEVFFEESGAGTRVNLLHTGLPESQAPDHLRGWRHFGGRLAAALGG